jgi:hypothetical protein
MRSMKKFGVLAVVAFALCAIGAANASAATFTASATGSLSGKATATQVFTTSAGEVKCSNAATSGTIASTASTEQHVTVVYGSCTAFGFPVHISPATYLFTADGTVHIKNTITLEVTVPFLPDCHITVGSQTVGSVVYANLAGGKMSITPNITGITYTTTGGSCGSGGNNGTYKGANEVERVGGGSISWDK